MSDWNKLILGEEDSQTAPVCNGTVREMIAEIDRLKAELEESTILNSEYKIITDAHKRQSKRYENIYRREFEAKQQLKAAESEITELDGALSEIKRQLAEARAENESYRSRDGKSSVTFSFETSDYPFNFEDLEVVDFGVSDNQYIVAAPKAIAEARQEAARECIEAIEDKHGILGLAFTLRQRFGLDDE